MELIAAPSIGIIKKLLRPCYRVQGMVRQAKSNARGIVNWLLNLAKIFYPF